MHATLDFFEFSTIFVGSIRAWQRNTTVRAVQAGGLHAEGAGVASGLKWGRIYWKNDKTEKTKVVVWDAIRTATKPEKKIWTAEIEIYPLVTSNGPPGYGKNCKMAPLFLGFGPL